MSHTLTPNAETPQRTLDELLDILRDNFVVFDYDRGRGDQHIDQMRRRAGPAKSTDVSGTDAFSMTLFQVVCSIHVFHVGQDYRRTEFSARTGSGTTLATSDAQIIARKD